MTYLMTRSRVTLHRPRFRSVDRRRFTSGTRTVVIPGAQRRDFGNRRAVVVAVAAVALAGCGPVVDGRVGAASLPSLVTAPPDTVPASSPVEATPATVETPTAAPSTTPAQGEAVAALDALPVKGRAPKTGYSRAEFPHWRDTDRDGCDADDQAVKVWATVELMGACREVAATMTDPYTGEQLTWGTSRVGVVDIDHVVSLSDAWQKGAQNLTREQRAKFANDPLNVIPVAASVNRAKGDSDAATWLPPEKGGFRCGYVARQVAVKTRHRLWVTAPEKAAMSGVLAGCPGQALPTGAGR